MDSNNFQMKLYSKPFELIKSGRKTIEVRCYDEKRKLIKTGDYITFTNCENPDDKVDVIVEDIAIFKTFEDLYKIKLNEFEVRNIINNIVPINEDVMNQQKINNQQDIRNDILYRFKEAPDLKDRESTGARLIQAVADTASHIEPMRKTKNSEENRFKKAIEGNTLLDRTMQILNVA